VVWTTVADSGLGGNFTGGEDDAASVNSDGSPGEFDTEIRSNVFSLVDANAATASLHYLVNYQNYGDLDYLDLDISTDGGSTWTNLLSWNEDHGAYYSPPGEAVYVDLTAYFGMENLQLRWHYYDPNFGDWDWYAQIDDVSVSCDLVSIKSKPINLKKKGVIPVVILSTESFDATMVDPLSVEFGPDGAMESHGKGHFGYVDEDDFLDLMLHFNAQETGIQCGDTYASLTGETFVGDTITGTDAIRTLGCK
jgi:hypothetical protein